MLSKANSKTNEFGKLTKEQAIATMIKELRSGASENLQKAGISPEPPIFIINAWALVPAMSKEVKFEEATLVDYVLCQLQQQKR